MSGGALREAVRGSTESYSSSTLCGLISQNLKEILTEWMCVAVTLFSQFDKEFLDDGLFRVHDDLSPRRYKCSIFVCAKVTSNINLNGAQFSPPSTGNFHKSHRSRWQEQMNHGPIHKLFNANPPTRRAVTETEHVRQGLAGGRAELN